MSRQIDLAGQTALVTGGATGIGRGIARALAEAGADVAITHHTHAPDDAIRDIEAHRGRAVAIRLDATDSAAVDAAIAEAATQLGGTIRILVNNAGGLIDRVDIPGMSDEHWSQVIQVNLSSVFYATRAALKFLPDGGRIVNISSLAAHSGGGPGAAAYAAAKAGVLGLTRGLAAELSPRGITVNAIAPGLILGTPFHETFTPVQDQARTIAATPLQRAGSPDDVAGAVLYLASPLASFCTGTTLELNGGTRFS